MNDSYCLLDVFSASDFMLSPTCGDHGHRNCSSNGVRTEGGQALLDTLFTH